MSEEEKKLVSGEEESNGKGGEEQAPDDDFAEADASASELEEEEEDDEEYDPDEEAPDDVRLKLQECPLWGMLGCLIGAKRVNMKLWCLRCGSCCALERGVIVSGRGMSGWAELRCLGVLLAF